MKSHLDDHTFINHCITVTKFQSENDIIIDENITRSFQTIQKRTVVENTSDTSDTEFKFKQTENRIKVVKPQKVVVNEKYIPKIKERKNIPENLEEEIPKYCQYIKETKSRGDGFCVSYLHPIQRESNKDWYTTKSKKVTTLEKFKQMMEYLNGNEYTPLQEIDIPKPVKSPPKVTDPTDKFNLLNDEQLLQIIRMKSQKLTTQEVADFIKLNFNVTINRNFVSKLWNGEINLDEEITNSIDYQQMLSNTKQRTIKNRKFTDEEIEWVKTNHLDKSLLERSKLFQIKFDKTITKTYISNLT